VGDSAENKYAALRRLGELGRAAEQRRNPDPYPRASGPAPTVQELRKRRSEIERVASLHGARSVHVFGSVARGDAGAGSDLDLLVDMERPQGFFGQAGLRSELEELLHCPIHIATTGGLRYAREHTRRQIEQEAKPL
jgi:uncharacterized protein